MQLEKANIFQERQRDQLALLTEQMNHTKGKMNDLEPFLRIKTDNKDIVRSFVDYVFRAWEEKYGYVYLKKSDADKEFNYFRNETESLDRKIK
jgi:hypothetical protein